MKILTHAQYKLDKSVARGYKTVGINLSPDIEAALILKDTTIPTMCAMSGTCADVCLVKTGMNVFPAGAKARAAKTQLWVTQPRVFVGMANHEILAAHAAATKAGMKFAVRPNLLSDQPKLAHMLAKTHPMVQFYDYTKLPKPATRVLPNYHLTYSVSERTTRADLWHCLHNDINLAVVVALRKGAPLPKTFTVMGYPLSVIDGDKDDLRFLDPKGCVVMLRWKGSIDRMNAGVVGGFVVNPTLELKR